jgi:hypothetical protein
MNHQAMEALYNERLKDIEHIINLQSADDQDMKQEGLLGAYLALRGQPTATDRYLLNKSQWEMVSSLRKGKSVDNGFYKRKNLKIIHYDHLPFQDGIFAEAVSSNGREPVDEQAIFRVDLERFFERLTPRETLYIRYKTMDGLSDLSIRKRLKVTFPQLYEMKRNIRKQIGFAFGV